MFVRQPKGAVVLVGNLYDAGLRTTPLRVAQQHLAALCKCDAWAVCDPGFVSFPTFICTFSVFSSNHNIPTPTPILRTDPTP